MADIAGPLRASEVIGLHVENLQDESLGSIEDVIIDAKNGQIAYVLVSVGGCLGIDESLTPVSWHRLRMTEDGEELVMDMARGRIENAPTIEEEVFGREDMTWRNEVDTYWGERG